MECPKCQVENIPGAEFCRGCGNKLEIVCPKCGFKQTYAGACAKCGIVFSKFKEKHPIEEKRYKITTSYLLFFKFIVAAFLIIGALLIIYRDRIPAGPEVAVASGIFFIISGIAISFFYIQAKQYFVSLNEKGINIAGRQIIPWEDIYNVDWHDKVYYYRGTPRRYQWIDIYNNDRVKMKRVKTRIGLPYRIEDLEDLYQEIMKRVISDIDGLAGDDNAEKSKIAEFSTGATLLVLGFTLLLLSFSPEGGKELRLIQTHPRLVIIIGIISFITGVIIIIKRWPKEKS